MVVIYSFFSFFEFEMPSCCQIAAVWICAGWEDEQLTLALSTGILENDRPHAGSDDSSTARARLTRRKAFATSSQLPRRGNTATLL